MQISDSAQLNSTSILVLACWVEQLHKKSRGLGNESYDSSNQFNEKYQDCLIKKSIELYYWTAGDQLA